MSNDNIFSIIQDAEGIKSWHSHYYSTTLSKGANGKYYLDYTEVTEDLINELIELDADSIELYLQDISQLPNTNRYVALERIKNGN